MTTRKEHLAEGDLSTAAVEAQELSLIIQVV